MKKFSVLSFFMLVLGICTCISCGYLISTYIVSSNLFQYASTVECEEQTVYAISMATSENSDELKAQKTQLQAQNGAGYIFEQDDKFYLLASVYENVNDAEKVKDNLKNQGYESEILNITLEKNKIEGNFSNEEKGILETSLKSNFDVFKSLYDVAISLDTNVFDLTKAKLECNTIFSNHVSTKTNLETFFKNQTSEIKTLQQNLDETNDNLSNLISENYENRSQTFSSLIKQTYCKILFD